MSSSLTSIVEQLPRAAATDARLLEALRDEAERLDEHHDDVSEPLEARRAAWFEQLRTVMTRDPALRGLSDDAIDRLAERYREEPAESPLRAPILRVLATSDTPRALNAFAELTLDAPPARGHDVLLAFSPLFQRDSYGPGTLFPRLLDGLERPLLAAVVLDLANYVTRRGLATKHPAAGRVEQLAALLGGLVHRLHRLEERPESYATTPQALSALVADSLALVVSLCDALGLIGEASIAGKLHQALDLSHRRVRTEAAAALARLGDERGGGALGELAAEPVVRTRALAYLEELGLTEKAPAEFRTPVARAEGELAAWLAMPTNFGAPPTSLELVDERTIRWPGYAEAVECRLFDFEYHHAQGEFTSVGIVGPVTHAFVADLEDLPPDDIYAMYAGWYAEHAEIGERSPEELTEDERTTWREIEAKLQSAGFANVELVMLGMFLGEQEWVATAMHDRNPEMLVAGDRGVARYRLLATPRAPSAVEMYWLHRGRRLLAAFNRGDRAGDVDESLDAG
jgi:hypothetical protein